MAFVHVVPSLGLGNGYIGQKIDHQGSQEKQVPLAFQVICLRFSLVLDLGNSN